MLLGPIILLPLRSLCLSASYTTVLCKCHGIRKHGCLVMQYGNEHGNHVSSNGFVCPYNNLIFYRFFYLFVYAYVPSLGIFFSFILSSVRFLTVVLLPMIHRYIFRFQFSWFFYPRLFSSFSGFLYVCAFSLHRSSWFLLQMCFSGEFFFTFVGIGYKQICFFMLNAKWFKCNRV